MRDCSWDTSVDFILWPWNCNYCALDIMCLKSIMPIENFLLPFLCCFKFKFKFTYLHPAQNLTQRNGKQSEHRHCYREPSAPSSAQDSGSAKGTAPEPMATTCPWVHSTISKNISGVPTWHQPLQGTLCCHVPSHVPPKHIHVPACRNIRDDTLQLKSKISLSFGLTSGEWKPLR